MSWTEDRVEKLTQLWKDGLTASQIANALGGVTRNAVIGKAHRLGLSGRPSPIKKGSSTGEKSSRQRRRSTAAKSSAPRRAPKAKAANRPQGGALHVNGAAHRTPPRRVSDNAMADKLLGPGVDMMALTETTCRWPVGDPRQPGFKFCGAKINPGQSYCEGHAAVAFLAARGAEAPPAAPVVEQLAVEAPAVEAPAQEAPSAPAAGKPELVSETPAASQQASEPGRKPASEKRIDRSDGGVAAPVPMAAAGW